MRPYWLYLVVAAVTTTTSLSAQNDLTSPATVQAVSSQAGHDSAAIPGIPTLPDAVTVVPFQLIKGLILFPGEMDGRRGMFMLDTGAQLIILNSAYLKTQLTNGVLDTVLASEAHGETGTLLNLHTIRVGTITHQLDSADAGQFTVNASDMSDQRIQDFGGLPPVLGLWGLPALRSFETIIDYPHKRLIFIALDKDGHRKAEVPAYTATTKIPLVKDSTIGVYKMVATMAGKVDTLLVDTGNPDNTLTPATQSEISTHLTPGTGIGYSQGTLMTLDTMQLAGKTYHPFPVAILDAGGYGMDVLGYALLNQLGVVGFNLRTQEFSIYGDAK